MHRQPENRVTRAAMVIAGQGMKIATATYKITASFKNSENRYH